MSEALNRAFITLSYDDGLLNNYDVALPLHEKYGIPASFAIIAGRAINPTFWGRHMNPQQIVDANRRGVEINSHGMDHRAKFTDLTPQDLVTELKESKRLLQGFLPGSQSINTLCLPFSASNPDVREKAFDYYTFVRGHGGRLNDPYDRENFISSFGLKNHTTFTEIEELIDRAVREKKWLILMLHGVVEKSGTDRKYDITSHLLEKILVYLRSLGPEVIKPISFEEMEKLKQSSNNCAPKQRIYRPTIEKQGAYTLAEAPGYLITYHKNTVPSDHVVISFGGLPSTKTSRGFGSTFLLKQGYDHIFVAQEAGTQYQELSLEKFIEVVQPYLQGKLVTTYGSSLGAYAALYYGGAVDAKIIASAPKNSAHRFMRKKKYSHVEFKHYDLEDVPRSKIPPLILFDPFREEETQFIEKWVTPAYPDSYLLKQPYAGHTVLHTMQESGCLKDFITTYIESGEILPFELKKEDSYIWHAEKGRRFLRQSHLDEAKKHFETSLEIHQNGEAAGGLARILLREGQPKLAQRVVKKNFEVTGTHKGVSPGLRSQIMKQLGD